MGFASLYPSYKASKLHFERARARSKRAGQPQPTRPLSSRRLRGLFCRSRLLHGAHVEIEQAFALVAFFFVLFAEFYNFLEDLDVESLALGLREYFLLLLVQFADFGFDIFDPFDERANLAAGNGDVRHGISLFNGDAKMPAQSEEHTSELQSPVHLV